MKRLSMILVITLMLGFMDSTVGHGQVVIVVPPGDPGPIDPGPGPGPLPICGNGVKESGEDCDGGECCNAITCDFKPAATVCRASAGQCDEAETCTGNSASCPNDGFKSSSTICRDAVGQCDAAETCTGSSKSCPRTVRLP